MPIAFAAPLWLWLAVPAVAAVVATWVVASRLLPHGRRIASLVVRLLLVASLVAVLAGARLALPADRLSVVFLVDGSASMVDGARADLVAFALRATREMPDGDTAGVVVFGANALVDRLPSDIAELPAPDSVPVVGATDIGAAIRLASAIFPAGTQRRLVLLSDGNDTGGGAEQAALAAASSGIRLDVALPTGEAYGEALVDRVEAPDGARVGETIDVTVRVRSTVATSATLRLLADGATVGTRALELEPGNDSVTFSLRADEAGFHVFRAILEPATDHFTENNAADAYTLVTGEPQVLVATDDAERAADLVDALSAARQQVTVVPSSGVPSSIATLAGYDAVVLDNVPADSLGAATMQSLQVYVRDLGKGLVMLGGTASFGAGGYLDSPIEETLPVYMTVRDKDRNPDVALVAVVDKSGSMADCHCTGDQMGSAQRQTRGFEKVDIAKEAILRAADALGATDELGVVAFDSGAHWAVRTGPISFGTLQGQLGFAADGETNIYAGLKAAYDDLVDNPASLRHIILITDGWSQSGAFDQLIADMKAAGITLSTIGAGGGSSHALRAMAEAAGGRYYDASDASRIPDIFLKETIRTAGERIVEETFQPVPAAPSEILRGLDATRLPQLLGYNATTPKGSATVSLLTDRDDPLLAQWQYGLGRSVAWTSDARQRWATPWIGTPQFGTLAAQLVSWTLPPQDAAGIDVRFSPGQDGNLNVEVTSVSEDGAPRNFYRTVLRLVSPGLDPLEATLEQVGPGRYAGTVKADEPGAYLVRVAQQAAGGDAATRTLGIVSPSADEYRRLGVDTDALTALAAAGGGRTLDPAEATSLDEVWRHDIDAAAFPTPIWPWLLLLATLLVPIDVGVRRVALTRADLRRARGWVARRFGRGDVAPAAIPGLAELRAVTARRRTGTDRGPTGARAPMPAASSARPRSRPDDGLAAPSGGDAPAERVPEPATPERAPEPSSEPSPGAETLAERLARRKRGSR